MRIILAGKKVKHILLKQLRLKKVVYYNGDEYIEHLRLCGITHVQIFLYYIQS